MNQHALNMKNALNEYKKATETAKQQIEFITTTYGREAGEAERIFRKGSWKGPGPQPLTQSIRLPARAIRKQKHGGG